MQQTEVVLVVTHVPDLGCAKAMAHQLLAEGLVACINIGAPVLSVYEWESKVHETEEIPLTIKTTAARQQAVLERLVALHPYEVPEALVVPATDGFAPYLKWVTAVTAQDQR